MAGNAEMARHYGNLRFAMFTVFTAVLGALIFLSLDKDRAALMLLEPLKSLLSLAGVLMSVGFLLAEIRVSRLVTHYQDAAFSSEISKPDCHKFWSWLTPAIMSLPYLFSLLFWGLYWVGCLPVPADAPRSH